MSDKLDIPTKEEIAQLPRWAIVAFAARCARRVQPLFKLNWPDAPKEHVKAVDDAIIIAEKAAARAAATRAAAAAAAAANAAARAAATRSAAAKAAADAAAKAAATALEAFSNRADAAKAAAFSACAAAAAADAAVVVALISSDFDILKKAAEREHWTGRTTVPQTVFWPMWPDGKPEGWPKFERVETGAKEKFYEQPPLEIYIEPGNASKETIRAVFEAISDWHIAAGGLGLEFSSDGYFTYATESVPGRVS